ncbi:unnamed protein product [Rotaria magnacalcarata]|uniref:Uncharacterized protein n=6 Tax=Rotaria magnacalcarata TaxID=392030 RepID=A0A815KPL9_9BILA|nr:unnamed protein product [Rotaria magnacalcarata]CAF1661179.1 unnamed protein product [Rotaria magnacalcarata]CAF2092842.1 unnamed protein product [Rotaria magnacalcarata]CAF2192302.1 unnamed protein product [Rotaria magnacalcarata]CAF3747346.1 unnamed protein product [Rotaria magnacalcarata]
MNSKKRPLPLEVSSWMERGLTLKKITANSRLLTNDTRQNIVLSRKFFSNLLTLSYSRYRKMAEYEFDKKSFLRNQQNRSEQSMPGMRSSMDQLTMGMNRSVSARSPLNRKTCNPLMCPSTQSFFSRSDTKTDTTLNRPRQPSPLLTKAASPVPGESEVTPIIVSSTSTNPRASSRLRMSRERLERLAQPKGYRPKSTNTHVRAYLADETTTAEDIFGKIDHVSEIDAIPVQQVLPEKPKSAVDDKRFHHLVGVFTEIHAVENPNITTVRNIVQANPSLQDEEGQWKVGNRSAISRKTELDRNRRQLTEKLARKLDVFLIDVGA